MMEDHLFVQHKLQQATTKLGEELVADVVWVIKELGGPALTRLGYMPRLVASCYNCLGQEEGKMWCTNHGAKNELMDMFNRENPPCVDSLFKEDV